MFLIKKSIANRHTLWHIVRMITYQWDAKKNALLKQARGVSFEQVVMHIEKGDVLDVIMHHNQMKYPDQRVLVVNMNDYAYAVPFVEQGQERFLKTIVPNRKLTRQYLR